MTNTIYIHQPEQAFSFTRLPNFLFEAPTFQPLSNEAKLLYAFILRRAELSRKNGWADEYGRIYLYYPICEVVDLLRCGRQKAVNMLPLCWKRCRIISTGKPPPQCSACSGDWLV